MTNHPHLLQDLNAKDLPRRSLGNVSGLSLHSSMGSCEKIARFQFSEKILKLFRSDLERTSKDTTLNPKTNQLIDNKFLPWRSFIHHRIRAQQSGLSDPRKGADQHVLR